MDSLGINSLDGIVATHPHSDHIGGLISVLNSVPVDYVWDNGLPYSGSVYSQYLTAVQNSGAQYSILRRGDELDWGDELMVEVFHPIDPLSQFSVNSTSIVLRVIYSNCAFLFTGDLESSDGEISILYAISSGDIENIYAEVLKVGHHGSSDASCVNWLASVNPQIGAIEVGSGNPYGHPHSELLSRLYAREITVYRTDIHGTFFISTDGDSIYYNSLPEEESSEPEPSEHLLLYPNPAAQNLTISWPESGIVSVDIYNLLGEKIFSEDISLNSYTWNLQTEDGGLASPGLYMVIISASSGESWRKCFAITR
jgi:beta-lactamase superfamily II metal-dependent hydrolase